MAHLGETSPADDGGRAFGLGPRRAVLLAAGTAVALVGVLLAVALSGGSSASGTPHRAVAIGTPDASKEKYGGLPSWLPKAKVPVGRVLRASTAHPALSIQGEGISVDLGKATVLATAAGPSVPEEGKTPVPETSPCTFIVSFAHATGPIALQPGSFKFIDERGNIRSGHVTAMNGGPAPTVVSPGQTVALTIKAVLPTGDGALTWAPQGRRPIASWDFNVEID
jgi:hypothetical protein